MLALAKKAVTFFLFLFCFVVCRRVSNSICIAVCPPFWGLKLPSQPISKVQQLCSTDAVCKHVIFS